MCVRLFLVAYAQIVGQRESEWPGKVFARICQPFVGHIKNKDIETHTPMDKLTSLLVYARGSAQTPRKRIVCESGRDGKLWIGSNQTTESQLTLGIQEIVKELIVRLEDVVGKVDWTQAEVQDMLASIKPMQETFDIGKKGGLDW